MVGFVARFFNFSCIVVSISSHIDEEFYISIAAMTGLCFASYFLKIREISYLAIWIKVYLCLVYKLVTSQVFLLFIVSF